jgi:hypothetical protein
MKTASLLLIALVASCDRFEALGDGAVVAIDRGVHLGSPDRFSIDVTPLVDGDGIFCTAVLVSPTVALTAGHCLAHSGMSLWIDDGNQTTAGPPVVAVRAHPRFGAAAHGNDIGLLVLAEASCRSWR